MTEAAGEGAGNKVGHVSGYAGLLQLDGGVDVPHEAARTEEAHEPQHEEDGEGADQVVPKVEGGLHTISKVLSNAWQQGTRVSKFDGAKAPHTPEEPRSCLSSNSSRRSSTGR